MTTPTAHIFFGQHGGTICIPKDGHDVVKVTSGKITTADSNGNYRYRLYSSEGYFDVVFTPMTLHQLTTALWPPSQSTLL